MVKRNKKGAPKGNKHALRHGAYMRRQQDGRTWQGKLQRHIEATLATALGGDPTPQQALIIQRLAVKAIRCVCLEREILSESGEVSIETEKRYLRWCRELRSDLGVLGLERRTKNVVNLKEYLEGNYEEEQER